MGFKGLSCLQAIAADGKVDCIAMVVGAKDELIQNDYYNTIADLCKSINIPFADRKENNTIKADLAIAVSWRWIIKLSPEMPLIVFHDSLLPKYGLNPSSIYRNYHWLKPVAIETIFMGL